MLDTFMFFIMKFSILCSFILATIVVGAGLMLWFIRNKIAVFKQLRDTNKSLKNKIDEMTERLVALAKDDLGIPDPTKQNTGIKVPGVQVPIPAPPKTNIDPLIDPNTGFDRWQGDNKFICRWCANTSYINMSFCPSCQISNKVHMHVTCAKCSVQKSFGPMMDKYFVSPNTKKSSTKKSSFPGKNTSHKKQVK